MSSEAFTGSDVLVTLIMFSLIILVFFFVFVIVSRRLTKQKPSNKHQNIEQKLDRIIELLEQGKK
ncbi:hypothetical protein CD33_04660 [Ureibacillus sinduriensis BLB-1 = JCM 15800]|uniref:Uncharacterized protein n=1 Tax=Ureibacillus sinduriensis BLB-1 = JCM 15800 TaxID=1384057 RepID=A0A0A3HWJ0_9BACL|nr:hypothetical protein CD33_04660 [Ureibacillus sinduriensis BLB-1 = JCM 15800]